MASLKPGLSLLGVLFALLAASLDEPELPKIEAPEGFVVEHLYSPTPVDSSTWVSLTIA